MIDINIRDRSLDNVVDAVHAFLIALNTRIARDQAEQADFLLNRKQQEVALLDRLLAANDFGAELRKQMAQSGHSHPLSNQGAQGEKVNRKTAIERRKQLLADSANEAIAGPEDQAFQLAKALELAPNTRLFLISRNAQRAAWIRLTRLGPNVRLTAAAAASEHLFFMSALLAFLMEPNVNLITDEVAHRNWPRLEPPLLTDKRRFRWPSVAGVWAATKPNASARLRPDASVVSEPQRRKIIEGWQEARGKMTQAKYAQMHYISARTLRNWIKRHSKPGPEI